MALTFPYFKISEPEPMVVIISGISGAGKDTVIDALRRVEDYKFHFVVTCNTRKPRSDEVDGVHYHFISHDKFREMIENGEMVEYSSVYNDFKGVPKFEIDRAFQQGDDIILRLDRQGAKKVKAVYPNAVTIFIVPPDPQSWLQRLQLRGADTEADLQTRIQTARDEISAIPDFDYLVVNDDLDQAVADVITILKAEHRRTSRIQVTHD